MELKIVTPKVRRYIILHGLQSKWGKCEALFVKNPKHPSLHTELLEPKEEMIFSFRLDKKYRALFMIKNSVALVFRITNHYR